METSGPKSKSIFDIIEEKKEKPVPFTWSKDPALFAFTREEFIFEGELFTCKAGVDALKLHKYVLTLRGLIRYKVGRKSDAVGEAAGDPGEDSGVREPPSRKGRGPRPQYVRPRQIYIIVSRCGFKLVGYSGTYEFLCKTVALQEEWTEKLRKVCVSLNISYRYGFGRMLGKGNFAKVHLAQRKKDDKSFAIKTIEKTKILENPRNVLSMQREINILRRIDHPNVIKLYEVYENELYVHLVLEYLKGGELFQKLQSKGLYSEKDASMAIKHVLEALDYCHVRNVVHRDLKPENLILAY